MKTIDVEFEQVESYYLKNILSQYDWLVVEPLETYARQIGPWIGVKIPQNTWVATTVVWFVVTFPKFKIDTTDYGLENVYISYQRE